MNVFRVKGVKIDGVVSCVPENKLDNETSLKELYGDEASLIIESTGIKTRYIANKGTSSSDLCLSCARDLLEGTKTAPEDVGAVVFVTFTPDKLMPFNAALIQEKLGLSNEIPCFDMSLACSGYAYGLYVASMFAKSCGKKVLLLDGDIQSAYMSSYDKSTLPVMADAGSATMVSPILSKSGDSNSVSNIDCRPDVASGASTDCCANTASGANGACFTKATSSANGAFLDICNDEWIFSFYTDGEGHNSLMIPSGGSASPVCSDDLEYKETPDGGKRRNIDIYMDGFAIFRFVAVTVSKWLQKFLSDIGESSESLDYFVPHQANMFMIKKMAKQLGFDWDEKTWQSGDSVGNSASATVPVTISFNAKNKLKLGKESRVLISGFGGGLSASAGIISLSPNAYYNFFQYNGVN